MTTRTKNHLNTPKKTTPHPNKQLNTNPPQHPPTPPQHQHPPNPPEHPPKPPRHPTNISTPQKTTPTSPKTIQQGHNPRLRGGLGTQPPVSQGSGAPGTAGVRVRSPRLRGGLRRPILTAPAWRGGLHLQRGPQQKACRNFRKRVGRDPLCGLNIPMSFFWTAALTRSC